MKLQTSIYNYSKDQLEQYFLSIGSQKFRATQVFEAIYKQRLTDFSQISNFKKEFVGKLAEDFYFPKLEVVLVQTSSDETKKFLYKLDDGNIIETVLMKHNYGYSVCVTTQVGCNMGCAFCASGTTKRIRNLETSEMVLQVLTIDNLLRLEEKRVSHVVIMGIGEPFDNYEAVLEFIKIINDGKSLEIGSRHITLSTCGIIPKIYQFSEFPLQVNLAVSLHFAVDEKRSQYMKINRTYNLTELKKALQYYFARTKRRITFEYILLDGINDSIEDAKNLVDYVKDMNAYINLIPYNETGDSFKRSKESRSRPFFDYLMKNKVNVTLRREQGHDIDAACGQLRVKELSCKD
jgi:23S rRNA (adenine2503-C2)-methyltransferase